MNARTMTMATTTLAKRRVLLGVLSGVLAIAAGCSSMNHEDGDGVGSGDSNLTGGGSWGAQVMLRDRSTRDDSMQTPAGGWYVTPIHTTLLPSGKIFVTGWSRAAKDTCEFPSGSRRNGASFILEPRQIDLPVAASPDSASAHRELEIKPLNENLGAPTPPWRKVLYCAGHAPVVVANETAVLLTGGSRYLDLGDRDREIEEGLRSAHLAFVDRRSSPAPTIDLLADGMKSGPLCQRNEGQELLPGETRARGGKWYPTNTRLPDGTVLVTGGFTGGPRSQCVQNRHSASAEIFDPATKGFRVLFQPEDLPDGYGERFAPGDKDYTHTLLLPEPVEHNGHSYTVAMMGYAGVLVLFDPSPTTAAADRFYIPPNASRPGDVMAWDSTMALVSTGEILVMGGTDDATAATRIDLYNPKTDAWKSVDTRVGRRNASATLLPDGKVLLINGWRDNSPSLGLDERTRPMIFDPETRKIESFEPYLGDRERGYHSFALLGKDGTVFVGGGIYPSNAVGDAAKESDIGCERTDVQAWKPPYLSNAASKRPVIDSPDAAQPLAMEIGGAKVSVRMEGGGGALDPKKGAVLMALGSFTHGFDQNQRYVRLAFAVEAAASGQVVVKLTPPESPLAAPPGDYLLFLVNEAGTPSVGQHVRLGRRR